MRVGHLLLLPLAACNQVYGLESTRAIDAAFFDVREDFVCPPIGETPQFSTTTTAIETNCLEYGESADVGRAVAFCLGGPVSGPIDGPFVPIAELAETASVNYVMPRLAPEGDRLFVRENPSFAVHVYRRTGDDSFTRTGTVPVAAGEVYIGMPARGGRMLYGYPTQPGVDEIVVAADGSFTPVRTHTLAELQVEGIAGVPNFTPDGLRITFPGRIRMNGTFSTQMFYADRAELGAAFGAARILENVPYVFARSPTLNETCSRLYTVSGSTLVWSQRL